MTFSTERQVQVVLVIHGTRFTEFIEKLHEQLRKRDEMVSLDYVTHIYISEVKYVSGLKPLELNL